MTAPERHAAVTRDSDAEPGERLGALRWLWCSLGVVVADQLTKLAAVEWLDSTSTVAIAPMLNLVLAYNTGAAFSLLSTAGGWQRWLFIGLAVVISAFIVHWLHSLPRSARWTPLALSLILGGAAGNVIDRVRHRRGRGLHRRSRERLALACLQPRRLRHLHRRRPACPRIPAAQRRLTIRKYSAPDSGSAFRSPEVGTHARPDRRTGVGSRE